MTLDELKKKIETTQAKSAVAPEMKAFSTLILTALKFVKENSDSISKENLKNIKDSLAYFEEINQKVLDDVNIKTKGLESQIDAKIALLKTTLKEVEAMKLVHGKDGKDAEVDYEKIVGSVLEQIPTPEAPELEPNELVEDINEATTLIKKDRIEGLADIERIAKANTGGSSTTFVNGKTAKNLNFTNATISYTGDTANITTSGSGGGTWGSITGTLSDQTDLQTALDAKLDGNGTATYIPFYSDANTLTSDSHFTYDSVNDVLHTHKLAGDATDGLIIESANGTDVGILGAGNTANATWYGNHNYDAATANTIASFGASKTLSSLSTATYPDLTELSYVKGVTSAIQTQLNAKQASDTQLTSLAGLSYTGNAGKFIRVNAGETDFELATVAGSGDVSKVGTPVNNQVGVWTGDGTLEGDVDLTFDTTTNTLAIGTGVLTVDTLTLTGTGTLNGVDAIDATTEATIEAAIDTLANLTSIQGRTVTLADAGANAIFGWDDVAGAYENLTQAEARTVLGLGTAAYVATDLADLNEATIESAIDTLPNLTAASALATVGTIGTGVWQGTTIKANYLQQAAADLGDADITVDLSNSNVGNVTNLTIDGTLQAGSIGVTGTRIATGFFTDLTVTNAISGSITGNAGTATALATGRTIGGVTFDGTANIVPQTIQSVNEATDTTCFPLFISASGSQSLQPLNNTNLTFNSNTAILGSTIFNAGTGFQIGGAASSGKILKANGTNFVASTETYAAPGTSGNVMTSDGTNWTSAAPAGGGASVTVQTPQPTQGVDGGLIGIVYNSNTTGYTMSYDLPFGITVNSIDIRASGAASVNGTIDIGIYSEDGQTKHIDVTSGTISASTVYHVAVSAVALAAGRYYLVIVPNGTANVELNAWDIVGVNFGDTGEPILCGTQTVTASTLPATFNPSSAITFSNSSYAPLIRLNA